MDDAVTLFAELGYDKRALALDLGAAPLPNVARAVISRSGGQTRRKGYAVIVAETSEAPRSLRSLARAMRDQFHDRPLGVLGITDESGAWKRMIVLRPRSSGKGTGITVTKLDVNLVHPTQHDSSVLAKLQWSAAVRDTTAQARVDEAFDVEEVTRRFFEGLAEHYSALTAAVQHCLDNDPAVADRLKGLGSNPAERAGLRILTQILFVEFLQRKGFVEGRHDWLTHAYRTKTGPFYATVVERLFYAGLGTPASKRKTGDPDVPYLNGGLFERFYGNISLPLPDEVFDVNDGLLGYLGRWTFTVHEDMPDEAEVAVDPEMLGKVFESLAGEESVQTHGTVYTPRPVVHFMCREALVPWLQSRTDLDESSVRLLLTDPDPFAEEALGSVLDTERLRRLAAELPQALDALTVIDPAVGSGAFPLGMLAEIVRLRSLCHRAMNQGAEPGPDQITAWKNRAIQHTLYGVDIEARAIELCRLRLWLSLLVDLPEGVSPQPLPNLEYRTVVADSLTDFVNGVEIQNTRGGFNYFSRPELVEYHRRWYHAVGDERDEIRHSIRDIEDQAVLAALEDASSQARDEAETQKIEDIRSRFTSTAREFPCFVPGLHAPDVAAAGGWDIVIMNPPYIGTEFERRIGKAKMRDLRLHHGAVTDPMVLFARRALELVAEQGTVSMIFNDSLFTSTDGAEIRRRWVDRCDLLVAGRTRCFEGRAVTGGIVVVRRDAPVDRPYKWIEGHGRPAAGFAEASAPIESLDSRGPHRTVGELEVWTVPRKAVETLPHRPLFRPSPDAIHTVSLFEKTAHWSSVWSKWDEGGSSGWSMTSTTSALDRFIESLAHAGQDPRLGAPGTWIMLGTVLEGGIGFQTGDDKRFLAAIEGTAEADRHLRNQERLEELTLAHPEAGPHYTSVLEHLGREAALIECWARWDRSLRWPKAGAFRIAPKESVLEGAPTSEQRENGIAGRKHFVPLEKGDRSDTESGGAVGARWWRENPIVLDWSTEAVHLIRERELSGFRKPYLRNKHLWFLPGVGWNKVASYLRPRLVPPGSVYGDGAIVVRSQADWLSPEALCALLGSDTADFILRTFSSRMNVYIGDIRRIPVPTLNESQAEELHNLGACAVAAKRAGEAERLTETEKSIDRFVRSLYGIEEDADLWVVR